MSWIIIPRSTAEGLASSKSMRGALSQELLEPRVPHAHSVITDGGVLLSLQYLGEDSVLVLLWLRSQLAEQEIRGPELLTIWNASSASTIMSVPEEELPSILERVCHLALRLWDNVALSEAWKPKKVADFHSVFLSTRLDDLRVAYELRTIASINTLAVGTVYFAYRQEKKIDVPQIDNALIANLPDRVTKPIADIQVPANGHQISSDEYDPDVLINRGRGEDRHLFSMTRSEWMDKESPLTRQQRRVINDKKCPLRIHGPGGSGKTLVLILKTLSLLADAAERDEVCKVLLVLHNNDVRTNVGAAIESIDEGGFLATTKADRQFLDVETLHGWCMRELRIDTGGIDYALHPDVIVSKRKQDELLVKVVEETLTTRLENNKPLMSQDAVALFEGPRDKLISNLRYEISIRIKGRGMRDEQQLYVNSPLKSFIGRGENRHDRYFIFKIAQEYEQQLQKISRLDTDDVVLTMQARLSAPLWKRQRKEAGYDFVFVDETHLFNENERRVLPYLTRGDQEYIPIIMTFDEAQSIGGRRSGELEQIGIRNSEQRKLSYVHRSSPEIYRLARGLIENSTLVFSEFSSTEAVARMSEKDLKKCISPAIQFENGVAGIVSAAMSMASHFRARNYPRVGIIAFDGELTERLGKEFEVSMSGAKLLRERGESIAGRPSPGIFVMNAENCGGLEFDAVILAGVNQGRIPPSLHNMPAQGHLSVVEESCKELYTAITRARYHVAFICDSGADVSEFIRPWIDSGAIKARK